MEGVRFELVTEEKFDEAARLVASVFEEREPGCYAFGYTGEEFYRFAMACKKSLIGLSWMILNENDEIVGVCLNEDYDLH